MASEDYKALLRGQITPEEYVERLKRQVAERDAHPIQYYPPRDARVNWFELKVAAVCGFAVVGFFDTVIHLVQSIAGWVS